MRSKQREWLIHVRESRAALPFYFIVVESDDEAQEANEVVKLDDEAQGANEAVESDLV